MSMQSSNASPQWRELLLFSEFSCGNDVSENVSDGCLSASSAVKLPPPPNRGDDGVDETAACPHTAHDASESEDREVGCVDSHPHVDRGAVQATVQDDPVS